MTGIQIPAALIPHQSPDPQASRPALTIDKLAALMPVPEVSQGDVQSSTGETVQARQSAALAAALADARRMAQTTSTRETLSFAARAILDLFEGGDAEPMRANAPLLPAPPASGNGQAATQQLSAALAALVDRSGMFYESHVAQWVSGQRPLALLLEEPQAALRLPTPAAPQGGGGGAQTATPAPMPNAGAPVALLPYGGPAAPATPPSAAAVLAELVRPAEFGLTGTYARQAPTAQPQAQGDASPAAQHATQNPGQASAAPPAEQRRAAQATAAAHAYQVTAEISHEGHYIAQAQRAATVASWNAPDAATAAPQPQGGPAVHPSSEGVVRQQLELLATQQFRCTVDAWPGMPVEWEVTREQPREGADPADAANAQWSTRLTLSLPRLGHVDAVLTLGPQGLQARLVASSAESASRLAGGQAAFRESIEARGIALAGMAVNTVLDHTGEA